MNKERILVSSILHLTDLEESPLPQEAVLRGMRLSMWHHHCSNNSTVMNIEIQASVLSYVSELLCINTSSLCVSVSPCFRISLLSITKYSETL